MDNQGRPSNSLPIFEYQSPVSSALSTHSNLGITQRQPALLDVQDRALLVRTDRARAGQVLSLGEATTTLGRHPDNTVVVDDEGISRFHAKLFRRGLSHCLQDMDSSNGTHVNGRRIESLELRNGDSVQLGASVTFRFTLATAAEELALKRLYESSVRDPLTQVFNRRHFESQTEAEIGFAKRHSGGLSLLLLDIDFFKRVNDTHGHLAGDEVLRGVAEVLGRGLRSSDLLARFGGEEFIALLRGTASGPAQFVADRLRRSVELSSLSYLGTGIRVSVSIGGASLHECGEGTLRDLVQRADRRLYLAKERGRNRVVFHDA